jgi:hypothetical protein
MRMVMGDGHDENEDEDGDGEGEKQYKLLIINVIKITKLTRQEGP